MHRQYHIQVVGLSKIRLSSKSGAVITRHECDGTNENEYVFVNTFVRIHVINYECSWHEQTLKPRFVCHLSIFVITCIDMRVYVN